MEIFSNLNKEVIENKLLSDLINSPSQACSYYELADKYHTKSILDQVESANEYLRSINAKEQIIFDNPRGGQGAWGICLTEKELTKEMLREKIKISLKNYLNEKFSDIHLKSYKLNGFSYIPIPFTQFSTLPVKPIGIMRFKEQDELIIFPTEFQYELFELFFKNSGYVDSRIASLELSKDISQMDLQNNIKALNATLISQLNLERIFIKYTGSVGFQISVLSNPRDKYLLTWFENNQSKLYSQASNELIDLNYCPFVTLALVYDDTKLIKTVKLELLDLNYFEENTEKLPFMFDKQMPYLLSMRSPLSKELVILEITNQLADVIKFFFNNNTSIFASDIKQNHSLHAEQRNEIRSIFNDFLKKLQKKGYSFAEGTGYAGRNKLIFPVIE
jgi:hypothetical protein